MASDRTEIVGVRPYARLLTMLGEQLIKNDRIALVELIKNSYDADATTVLVDLVGFSSDLVSDSESRVRIIDDGHGMTDAVIRNHWLNPATPLKQDLKKTDRRSPGGRIIQGEKGIGRFAMFKLGNRVEIVTRAEGSSDEHLIDFDLSFLDDDSGEATHAFIEDIEVVLTTRSPQVFCGDSSDPVPYSHGTVVEISGLRSRWTDAAVRAAYTDVARLQPLVPQAVHDPMAASEELEEAEASDFNVAFSRDGVDLALRDEEHAELARLFEDRAVVKVSGHFSMDDKAYLLHVNGHTSVVGLDDPAIAGLWVFRRYFARKNNPRSVDDLECGPFDFSFYVFDLTPKASTEHRLDKDEREKVKDHRIYLYRDGVRVLPYGDPEDDWLQLDVIRGTQGADQVLSNDQTVGFVYITQQRNPLLQDKTNREGLLETGHALQDFVALLQVAIGYVRHSWFARYLAEQTQKADSVARREKKVSAGFDKVLKDDRLPKELLPTLRSLERSYRAEQEHTRVRLERTEDLAGVGLSVEAASHDIVSAAGQALRQARSVSDYIQRWLPQEERLKRDAQSVVEGLAFVTARLEDVQGLFVSTRRPKRVLEPADFVSRVYRIYSGPMKEHDITLDLDRSKGALKVRTTEAGLLQVLVNLYDNAIYWMVAARTQDPMIRVVLEPKHKRLTFADNGPGVRAEDEDFIFEPFFSGRGEEGKGLGLYIARQVSARNGFRIDLVTADQDKVLSGANFWLTFGTDES